jgi:hypothetical protein
MGMETCPDCGAQVQSGFRFCPGCARDLQRPIECPGCGYSNESNSRFCQECGRPLRGPEDRGQTKKREKAVAPRTPTTLPPPADGITIEFPFSASLGFEFAVQAAAKHPSFQQFGEGKKAIYRTTYPPAEMTSVIELVEHLKGWRNRSVYVDGQKVPWKSVFEFLWCFQKRQGSFKPEFYCFGYENQWEFNIWGCTRAMLPFTENAEWFCWGRFVSDQGDWQFDKERIRHELDKRLYPYRFCPALETQRVSDVLSAFPQVVSPKKDKDWKLVENWGGAAVSGLVIKVTRYGMVDEVVMKGVCPNGYGALKRMGKSLKFRLPSPE